MFVLPLYKLVEKSVLTASSIVLTMTLLPFSGLGQHIDVFKIKRDSFPSIQILVHDRNPIKHTPDDFQLFENEVPIAELHVSEEPQEASNRMVFILLENSYWASYKEQNEYLKSLLSASLDGFNTNDVLIFSEFDWTGADGKVLLPENFAKGNKDQIRERIASISEPYNYGNRQHKFSEVYMALAEALEYLDGVENADGYSKSILILSGEVPNIHNIQYTKHDVIASSFQKDIPIYAIRYPRLSEKYNLAEVAQSTFGLHYKAREVEAIFDKDVDAIKNIIMGMPVRALGHNYLVSYTSLVGPGNKDIRLELNLSGDIASISSNSPSYFTWLMANTIRTILSASTLMLLCVIITWIIVSQRKKKKRQQMLNEQQMEDLGKESDRKLKDYHEGVTQEQKAIELDNIRKQQEKIKKESEDASAERLAQLTRKAVLSNDRGQQFPLTELLFLHIFVVL